MKWARNVEAFLICAASALAQPQWRQSPGYPAYQKGNQMFICYLLIRAWRESGSPAQTARHADILRALERYCSADSRRRAAIESGLNSR